ncbi:MAG: MGMT family protein [Bacteroidales bacterium]|nr:MGMT family protein [Bacteroidales bacterium]
MSDFFKRVYQVTRSIPPGRVTSYGAIAKAIGSPSAGRMVGWALNSCHLQDEFVPAHRVVNRVGMLTGKHNFGTPGLMQQLLENEGVKVTEDKVMDFEALFWKPEQL